MYNVETSEMWNKKRMSCSSLDQAHIISSSSWWHHAYMLGAVKNQFSRQYRAPQMSVVSRFLWNHSVVYHIAPCMQKILCMVLNYKSLCMRFAATPLSSC
jgi:hypothetical protein